MVTIAVCDDHYQDLQLTKQQIEQIITAHYAGIPHQILLYSSGNALLKDASFIFLFYYNTFLSEKHLCPLITYILSSNIP